MACLIISAAKNNKGSMYKLDKLPMSVGREVQRDIQIMDPKVSRKHFIIKKVKDDIVIVASEPKNGVYVNGKKIEGETVLKDSDRIIIGETEMTYLVNDDPARIDQFNKMRQLSPEARAPTIV